MGDLDPILRPRSIAVVGASRRRGAVGRRILDALVAGDFRGPVYPVNPEAEHVGPHPCFASLEAIGRPVDLAVAAVPAGAVLDVVDEAIEHGVQGIIVVSAGFAEAGEHERERELRQKVRGAGLRLVGPNCLGVMHLDPEVRLNASFVSAPPPPGGFALCSQSGALGVAVLDSMRRAGIGLRALVSIGNAADVGVADLLAVWGADPEVTGVLLYLEAIDDPPAFAEAARRVARDKPVLAVKAGRTEVGSAAAASHTAALAGADDAADVLLRDSCVLRLPTLQAMLEVARYYEGAAHAVGERLGIVTNSGGPGILAADAAAAKGFDVVGFEGALRRRLDDLLPDEASTSNPVDMVASAGVDEYRDVARAVATSGSVDALVVIYTEIEVADLAEIAAATAAAVGETDCAVVAVVIGSEAAGAFFGEGQRRIPVFENPARAIEVLAAVRDHGRLRSGERREKPSAASQQSGGLDVRACRAWIAEHAKRGGGWLDGVAARRLCQRAGFEVAPFRVAHDADEAARCAEEFDGELALSVLSREVVHKTEHGGVVLRVEGAEDAARAFDRIRDRMERGGHAFEGVLVSTMLEGTQVLIGAKRQGEFGPLVTFGLGGVLVELLGDVAFGLAPLASREARAMIERIRGFPMLEGYRGRAAADIDALVEALVRASELAAALPEIEELDMNPVFAGPEGAVVADVRLRIAGGGSGSGDGRAGG